MLSDRRQDRRDQAPLLPHDARDDRRRPGAGARAAEVDALGGRTRARRRLHGRAGADAVGLGAEEGSKRLRAEGSGEAKAQKATGERRGQTRPEPTDSRSACPILSVPARRRDDLLARGDAQRLGHVAIDGELGRSRSFSRAMKFIDMASGVFGFFVSPSTTRSSSSTRGSGRSSAARRPTRSSSARSSRPPARSASGC